MIDIQPQSAPPKGALLTIFFIALTDMLGFGLVIPLLPFYARHFEASAVQVTLLFTVYSLCQFVATPILGAWSDRIGRRPILMLSMLGNAVGYALLAWASGHEWTSLVMGLMTIYLARVIAGMTAGNISAAQAYIADITTPENRTRGMGALGAAFGLGFSIGPAAGGLMAHYINPAAPAWAAAGMGCLAAALSFFLLKEARDHRSTAASNYLHLGQFSPLLANRPLMKVNASWFIAMTAFVAVDSTIVMLLADIFGYGTKQVAMYLLLVGMVIVITQGGLVGRLSRRFGEWPLCIAGLSLNGLGSLLTAVTVWNGSTTLLFGAAVVYAFGRSLFQPSISALMSHHSEADQQGLSAGFFQAVGTLARIVGPIGAGYLYAAHKSSPWLAGWVMLWLTALGLWHLRSREAA